MSNNQDGQHRPSTLKPQDSNGQRQHVRNPRSITPVSHEEALRTGHDGTVPAGNPRADIDTETTDY